MIGCAPATQQEVTILSESNQSEPPGPQSAPSQSLPPKPGPSLVDLINVVADKIQPIIKLLESINDRHDRDEQREIQFQTRMTWVAVLTVALIVVVATALTYLGKSDGSTFTFLLGLIVGYVLTFVRDQITGPN